MHRIKVICRQIHSSFTKYLRKRWRAKTRLCKLHSRIKHLLVAGNEGSDTATTCTVPLRDSIEQNGVILQTRNRQCRYVLATIVAELAVCFIAEKE